MRRNADINVCVRTNLIKKAKEKIKAKSGEAQLVYAWTQFEGVEKKVRYLWGPGDELRAETEL